MNYNDAKRYVRSFSTVRYVEERPFMIAVVELIVDGQRSMVAKGLSTCSPTDRWDTKMGQDIARGRAEAKLARRIMRMTTKYSTNPSIITTDTMIEILDSCSVNMYSVV